MTISAIQGAINIAAVVGINPMQIISIRPEDGSGNRWLYRLSGVGEQEQYIDLGPSQPERDVIGHCIPMMQEGKFLNAVKYYKENTNCSLNEAMNAVGPKSELAIKLVKGTLA